MINYYMREILGIKFKINTFLIKVLLFNYKKLKPNNKKFEIFL